MAYQDIALGLVFDGADVGEAALTYAMSLIAPADGRLTSLLCVPWIEILGAPLIPLADAVVAQVNEERLGRAAAMKTTIESAATIQAFDAQVRILNERRGSVIKAFSEAIRLSDLCVLPRPAGEFGPMKDIVEAAIFKSGRPIIIVPSDHIKPAEFGRIVVAWDGSARAARAVGDSLSFLQRAKQVDIVCVSKEPSKQVSGSDLAAHLTRRCKHIELIELPLIGGEASWSIREYALNNRADLIVMGAVAHTRLFEVFLGGTTDDMIIAAETPVFLSY